MKKTLALILSVLALLIPVSAIELDVAEAADVSVADEAVLAALPETTDATYGDLIYFSDFDENTNWVNTAVVGENATASFQLAYVQKGNWGSNKVADPNGENGNVQEIIVADHKYNWASGINVAVNNATLEDAVITMVYDVYFPNPVEECFKAQLSSGWEIVSSADYDAEKGGWQTIVMNIIAGANVSNGQYGFNFICNDTDKTSGTGGATIGLTYYIDNVRVYAREASYASKPAAVDSTLGNLVYFDNGNSTDAVSSDKIAVYGVSDLAVVNGYYAKKLVRDESGAAMLSPGLIVKSASGTFAENGLNGTITVLTDVYTSSRLKYYPATDIQYTSSHWGWGSWYAAGSLYSDTTYTTFKTSVNTSKAVSAFGFMREANSGSPYARSIAVYYMPATRVTVDGVIVDLNGMTEYTLPEFDTAEYDCYKDANGKFYAPGTYAVADINGKVFTPYLHPKYATKPADFSQGRGILVYFDNGNEADFYSNMNATLVGYKNTTDADGYFTRDLGNPAAAGISNTVGIGLDTGDTDVKLAYADGTDMNGAIYLVVDMYNNSDSNNVFYRAVRTNGWDGWCGVYTDWKKYTANSKQWTNIAEAFNSELSFIGFADTDNGNWQGSTFRSVYAYYMPNSRITLNDKVNPQIIDLTNKTEYTFPEISDGNTVWAGQDGSYYFPGDVAAVSDINGVTFDTANFNAYAPETESGVEMRVTSDTSSNGIRFKASIAPSKKAEADEIGFIVAREDVLDRLNSELTFDLTAEGVDNAEGKLFVKGVAYDKASEKDVVYDTNEDGTEVFTGVCVGIDVTNKAQVNTVLVARPYLKMTVGGKQIAVYGAANSASLAGVANDIKTAAEAGDEAALEAYNGAKEYIDGVISVGAGK